MHPTEFKRAFQLSKGPTRRTLEPDVKVSLSSGIIRWELIMGTYVYCIYEYIRGGTFENQVHTYIFSNGHIENEYYRAGTAVYVHRN